MGKFVHELAAPFRFLAAGLRSLPQNASLFPSSPFLVRAMVRPVPLQRATCVVELGTGVGTVTAEILKHLPKHAHLHAIELDKGHLDTTVARFADPRLRPIHGTAAETHEYLRADGCTHGADAVFSSLGLALMEPPLRDAIIGSACRALGHKGVFVQYGYLHARVVTYTRTEGLGPFHAGRFLDERFAEIHEEVVIANAPPAAVYVCRKPRRPALAIAKGDARPSDRRSSRRQGRRRRR